MTIGMIYLLAATAATALLSLAVEWIIHGIGSKPSAEEPEAADGETNADGGGVSIVVVCNDNPGDLEANLPALLSQKTDTPYEVIVVDESTDGGCEDTLKRLASQYAGLYTTFIPKDSRWLSRRKLALTLGIKAAKYDWLILMEADYTPQSESWLETVAAHFTADTDLVLPNIAYNESAGALTRYLHLQTACRARLAAHHRAYRSTGGGLAIRKSVFMDGNGFLDNLKYLRGEYDFLVNDYASHGNTAILTAEEATLLRRDTPSKTLQHERLSYRETRRRLRHGFMYHATYEAAATLLHLTNIGVVAALAAALYWQDWTAAGAAAALAIAVMLLRTAIIDQSARRLHQKPLRLAGPWLESFALWHNIYLDIRHRTADKYDFIRR